MNEDDLRDCFAMFTLLGVRSSTNANYEEQAKWCYEMADAMIEARKHKEKDDEENSGITAVVPKRSRKR
jgi:hypothetical protein